MSAISSKSDIPSKDKITWEITSEHISNLSGAKHVYMRQTFNNLEIIGTESSFHFDKNDILVQSHNRFSASIGLKENRTHALKNEMSCDVLLKKVAESLKIKNRKLPSRVISQSFSSKEILMEGGELSDNDILFRGVYYYNENKELEFGYLLEIDDKYSTDWWEVLVNSRTGDVVKRTNYTRECEIHSFNNIDREERNQKNTLSQPLNSSNTTGSNCYLVYPYPLESPYNGPQATISTPANSTASPFGWHDDNGVAGHEYTTTRGNNVYAKIDSLGDNETTIGFSPEGGNNLNFNFPLDLNDEPHEYQAGAVTNLFYWNNLIHDVMHFYGFDEAAGNFQETNYSGNGAGSDFVYADAQDNGNCNANFSTPTDGGNPRMQMYTCNGASPSHDSDLDNGVIVHEYGHGISIRLTGGSGTSSCLNNTEQMGEGWSDFYAMMFTMEPGDMGADKRGMGNYLVGQPIDGDGIRPSPYSTDLNINPQTYSHISNVSIPHGVGSVWCTMLWEMNWALVDHYGFDADIYNGTGGNNIALALVTEGLKLQNCSPGFVDGRDAILKADTMLYGGANSCLIWGAFAKRGLGYSADQGSTSSVSDGMEAFDLPPCTPSNCFDTSKFYAIADEQIVQACDTFRYDVCISSASGYTGSVSLSSISMLDTAKINYSNATPSVPNYFTIEIIDTMGLPENDTFEVAIFITNGLETDILELQLLKYSNPQIVTLNSPSDNYTTLESNIDFNWVDDVNAQLFNFQTSLFEDFSVLLIDTLISDNTLSISSMSSDTTYWRVRGINDCHTGTFSSVRNFQNAVCNAIFRDPGGTNRYSDQDDRTYILCSNESGETVVVDFSIFEIEFHSNCVWDYLDIYQGDVVDENKKIGRYCGSGIDILPNDGHIYSTDPSGCLTFVFHADQYVVRDGWEALITCTDCPTIAAPAIDIQGVTCSDSSDGRIDISNPDNFNYDFLLVNGSDTTSEQNNTFQNLATGEYQLIGVNSIFPACDTIFNTITIPLYNSTTTITTSHNDCAVDANSYIHLDFSCPGDAPNFLSYLLPGNISELDHQYDYLSAGEYEVYVFDTDLLQLIHDTTIIIEPIEVLVSGQETIDTISDYESSGYTGLNAFCTGKEITKHTNSSRIPINNFETSESEIILDQSVQGDNFIFEFEITHTYVADLVIEIENPQGDIYTLFDIGGCSQDNLHIITSDTSTNSYTDFQNQCMTSSTGFGNQGPPYAKEGSYQAYVDFDQIDFSVISGSWKLRVTDEVNGDEGFIDFFTIGYNEISGPDWYSDATGQNLIYSGSILNPFSSSLLSGQLPQDTFGRFTYYTKCEISGCSSELIPQTLIVTSDEVFNQIADCQVDTLTLDDNNLPSIPTDRTVSANMLLESEGLIPSHYNTKYTAGDALEFNSGFEIQIGALFEANIEECQKQNPN